MPSHCSTENEEHDIPSQILMTILWIASFAFPRLQLFFKPKYVWFPAHLYGPVIPNSSGQLAELIGVYIIPQE